jgi:hypothetical protein
VKVIIAGGRHFDDMRVLVAAIVASGFEMTEVVSGAASGADRLGERWARMNGVPVKRFYANWDAGKWAGPNRNAQMAVYADALIALPGGRGTSDMIRAAKRRGLKTWVVAEDRVCVMLLPE